jgi:prepilin-type N-terminal cleavage/methylation domain-containing protein
MENQMDLVGRKNIFGFTMVEILMSISLLSVLVAVATTQYMDYRKEAKTAVTNKKLVELREALIGNPEIINNGQYTKPGIINDLGAVPSAISNLETQGSYSSYSMYEKTGWRGPYVNNVSGWSQDGWGTAIVYNAGPRTLVSCGDDRNCATVSDNIVVPF